MATLGVKRMPYHIGVFFEVSTQELLQSLLNLHTCGSKKVSILYYLSTSVSCMDMPILNLIL